MRKGWAVGASAVVAQGGAGSWRAVKRDQFLRGHFGTRVGLAVGAGVVVAQGVAHR